MFTIKGSRPQYEAYIFQFTGNFDEIKDFCTIHGGTCIALKHFNLIIGNIQDNRCLFTRNDWICVIEGKFSILKNNTGELSITL
jgi:hypothetical protein